MFQDQELYTEFSGLIKSLASEAPVNSVYSMEDYEQELWCKLLTIRDIFKELSKKDIFKLAKVVFKNHRTDIIRAHQRKTPYNTLPQLEEVEDQFEEIFLGVFSHRFHHPETVFEGRELAHIIGSWVVMQDEDTRRILSELANPSPEVTAEWEKLKASYPRFKSCVTIPTSTLCRILNISESKWYLIKNNLKRYVKMYGYLAS